MNKHRWAMPLAAAALLAGCEFGRTHGDTHLRPDPEDAPECRGVGAGNNNADCKILVNVVPNGVGCTITVKPGQETVAFAAGASKKWVLWRIEGGVETYRFTTRGIEFKNDEDGNFSKGMAVQGGRVFRWKNRNEAGDDGDYEYGIEVRHQTTGVPCGFDPVIKNQT
jgi:hypothetical protein